MEEYPIELKLQALEISLKHADKLFPQYHSKLPSEYLSNASRILDLVTNYWDKSTDEYFSGQTGKSLRNNP